MNTHYAHFIASSSQSLTYATDLGIGGNSSLTMEAKIRVTSSTNGAILTHSSQNGSNNYCWVRYNASTGKLAVSSGYGTPIDYTANLTVGTWYHVALTRASDNSFELFIDGVSVATGSISVQPLSTNIVSIGKAYNASEYFDGDIDEIRYWNVIRTATEILNNKDVLIDSATNLVGSWHVDNALTDSSGNGYTLTNNNTVTFISLATNVTVSSTVLSATFSVPASIQSGDANVAPAVQTATFSIPTVTPSGGATVVATALAGTLSLPLPSVNTPDALVTPSAQTATFSLPTPTAVISDVNVQISAPVQSISFSTPAPTVSAQQDAIIAMSVVSGVFSLPAETIVADKWQNNYTTASGSWSDKY